MCGDSWEQDRAHNEGRSGEGQGEAGGPHVTRDDELKAEGHVDETVGKVEAAVGRTRHKAGDAITRVSNAVKR
jgi:uncharacterized protein YjbJ (UPF0337 family)